MTVDEALKYVISMGVVRRARTRPIPSAGHRRAPTAAAREPAATHSRN